MEHRFCYRFLERYYRDYCKKSLGEFKCFRRVTYTHMSWTMDVVVWWNEVITKFELKRRCLYLYGRSNTGKSTFVEWLIGRNNMKYVFYAGVGKFFMQDFDASVHKVILFEEFDYELACVSMIKRLLEGRAYAYPVKCEMDKIIKFTGPIIFVSNDNDVTKDTALYNRLLLVAAYGSYWETPQGPVPKTETVLEPVQDVFEISSEEDNESPSFTQASGFSQIQEVSFRTQETQFQQNYTGSSTFST